MQPQPLFLPLQPSPITMSLKIKLQIMINIGSQQIYDSFNKYNNQRLSINGTMSIYSGFATRHQEQSYDQCVGSVLYILQKRIIKFYSNEKADEEKFMSILSKLHNQMKTMESHKYLQPKSSNSFQELIAFLKNKNKGQPSIPSNKGQDHQPDVVTEFKITDNHSNANGISNAYPQNIPKSQKQLTSQSSSKLRSETGYNKIRHRHPSHLHTGSRNPKVMHEVGSFRKQKSIGLTKNKNFESNHEQQTARDVQRRKIGTSGRCRINRSYRQQLEDTENDGENDVRSLIRGYLSKTKRNYIKNFNKKKQQIDSIFKNNL